jgi:hypothetical protein
MASCNPYESFGAEPPLPRAFLNLRMNLQFVRELLLSADAAPGAYEVQSVVRRWYPCFSRFSRNYSFTWFVSFKVTYSLSDEELDHDTTKSYACGILNGTMKSSLESMVVSLVSLTTKVFDGGRCWLESYSTYTVPIDFLAKHAQVAIFNKNSSGPADKALSWIQSITFLSKSAEQNDAKTIITFGVRKNWAAGRHGRRRSESFHSPK